jgi:hypothetical protein
MAIEKSEPRNVTIAIYGVATVVLLVVTCIALFTVYDHYYRKYDEARGKKPSDMLQILRNEETMALEAPPSLNRETGNIRVPIALAMDLEARRPWRPNTPRAQPTPTPTPIPTPEAAAMAGQTAPAADSASTTATQPALESAAPAAGEDGAANAHH